MKRKIRQYTVQRYSDVLGWQDCLETNFCTKGYALGWVRATLQYYPCPDQRIIDAETQEVIQEFKGNRKVQLA